MKMMKYRYLITILMSNAKFGIQVSNYLISFYFNKKSSIKMTKRIFINGWLKYAHQFMNV